MRQNNTSIHCTVRILLGILLLAAIPAAIPMKVWPQTAPDFSGLWRQDNDRCQPKRTGDITLHIEQSGLALMVETTISRAADKSRHAVQKYTTDGKVSVSTGTDGDEFHTSVVWKNSSLVFSIEEHEDGRILPATEIWLLTENGATLLRTRERPGGEKQILFYSREPSASKISDASSSVISRSKT